jgi:hypothetical protein
MTINIHHIASARHAGHCRMSATDSSDTGQWVGLAALDSGTGGQAMLCNLSDLAALSVHAHQERLREEARAARRGSGTLRLVIGDVLVRLGEIIGGVPAHRAGTAIPNPVALS